MIKQKGEKSKRRTDQGAMWPLTNVLYVRPTTGYANTTIIRTHDCISARLTEFVSVHGSLLTLLNKQ